MDFKSPVLDEWNMGCPKSPMWESEGEAWSEDEDASSTVSCEGNVCNGALHVVGLHGPGDKISLFLQDWELGKVVLSCPHGPGHAVPGNACRPWWMLRLPDESCVKRKKEVNDMSL